LNIKLSSGEVEVMKTSTTLATLDTGLFLQCEGRKIATSQNSC